MTFGERLTQLRKENGFPKRKAFAEKLNIPETTLRNYETDAREPGHTFLVQVSNFFNVSIDWLLGNSQEKELKNYYQLKVTEYKHIEVYRELDDFGRRSVDITLERETERVKQAREAEKKIKELEQNKPQNTTSRLFAYYGKIAAAGQSFEFDDLVSGEFIEVPETPDNLHADYTIGVSGNSMEPTYYDGDIVYVKKVERLKTGDIGIFQKDNCIYIKEAGDNGLISHNSSYGFMPGAGVKLLGKVIGKVEEDYRIIK